MIRINLLQILKSIRILRNWLFLLVVHRQKRNVIDSFPWPLLESHIIANVDEVVSIVMGIIITRARLIFESLLSPFRLLARRSCEMGCYIPRCCPRHILRSMVHFEFEVLLALDTIVNLLRIPPHLTKLFGDIRFWRYRRQHVLSLVFHLLITPNLIHWTQILGRCSNLIPRILLLPRLILSAPILLPDVKVTPSFHRRRPFILCNLCSVVQWVLNKKLLSFLSSFVS